MVVELRTLRVTSDFDAARYVAGMNQKVNADKAGSQSSKAAGAAVEELKIKVSSAVPLIERLSRTYIDGYGSAAKFNTELLRLARSQDTNAASVEHLELIYSGLQRKFGLIADASALAARGYTGLASAIENVNQRLNQTGGAEQATALASRIEQLRQQFDPAYVSAQRLSGELGDLAEAERLGVQITAGYERALEAIILKHDAAAAAAKRQRDEYARLAQEARAAAAADRQQAAFNERLGIFKTAGLSASDSAAVFAEQLSRQEEINRLRALQQGTTFTSDLNERLGLNGFGTSARSSAAAFEEAARASEELDRKVAALRAQIDPLGAAQRRLNSELAEYDDLARRNAITTDELARAQMLAGQRYDQTAKQIEKQGATGLQRARMLEPWQVNNLMYQGYDVVQSLALGMPAMQVFLQQGPQIAQIFSAGNGAIKAMLGMLTPLNLALGGTAAVVLLGAKAWYDYLKAMKEVETAASGLGRGTAGSMSEMEEAARAGAAAAGISVSAARAMEVQFLRTGRIGAEHFEDLIALSKDFGATIGVDTAAAGQKLSEMFADPANAAKVLYQQYGLISSATARQATNLAAQNRESEAQAVLLQALPPQLADAEKAVTALGRAWQGVSTFASDAYGWMGRAAEAVASGPTIQEQIAKAQADLQRFSGQSWLLRTLNGADDRANAARDELYRLQEMERRQGQLDLERQRRASEIARGRRVEAYANSSGANADALRIETLQNEIAALRGGQNIDGIDQGRVGAALEAKTRVLDALINRQARALELDRLEIQIQNELNPLVRADLEQRRTRVQMADQEQNAAKIDEEAARARFRIVEETIASATAQNRDMQAELATRLRLNALVAAGSITTADANRILQEELSLRGLVEAATMAEGTEKQRLQAIVSDLKTGYEALAQQRKEEVALSIFRGQEERLENLQAEILLVGQSEEVRRRALAMLEAEQQIRREGLGGTARAQEIRANTVAMAEQTAAAERLRDAWGEVSSAVESAVDQLVDNLIDGDWRGALTGIAKEITGALTQLGIKNPLLNGLDGGNRGTISDLGGLAGIWSRLTGGTAADPSSIVSRVMGQSVGAMTVTAGTVVINGGVGGAFGNIFGAANDNISRSTTLGEFLGLRAANQNVAAGGGSALGFVGNYKSGVDARLTDILDTAARQFGGYKVDAMSGFRPGDPRFHGKGLATDIQLTDLASGKLLGNYQDASSFAAYERFAQTARAVQMAKYPELADKFRWGGYFSGGKGKYGALDTMHFDLAGAGMGGGSWEGGLTAAQRSLWPGIESKGIAAASALDKLAGKTTTAADGLGILGGGLDKFGSALSNVRLGGGAGGGFNWGSLFSSSWTPNTTLGSFLTNGFRGGGPTGGYDPDRIAGVVHEREFVFDADATARIGVANLEAIRRGAMRGYRKGGYGAVGQTYVAPLPANDTLGGAGFTQIIHNYSGEPVVTEEASDGRGGKRQEMFIGEAVAQTIGQPGNPANKKLKQSFGLRQQMIRR